jgi:TPR repeat protein
MTYVLLAWRKPGDLDPPADAASAYRMLRGQRAMPEHAAIRFAALEEALHARFPPRPTDEPTANDAWVDGSGPGEIDEPVLPIALNADGRHFGAVYQHVVARARRVGLNIYDPVRGEHFLVDGTRLPQGPPIDEASAMQAWRSSAWRRGIRDYRKAIGRGSTTALHDLAHCIRHGLGDLPRDVMLAGAMMLAAAAKDDARRRHRLETLKMLHPELRPLQARLRDELRHARDQLELIDRELDATKSERKRLEALSRNPSRMSMQDWQSLQMQAQCGDHRAALMLAHAFRPGVAGATSRPPWSAEPLAYQRYVMLAARQDSVDAQRRVAAGLASGADGWPHEPGQALTWMKRAILGGAADLADPAIRLRRKLRHGWDPAASRVAAETLLRDADRERGSGRVRLLCRACEHDHPEGWRRLGLAYLMGTDGLREDKVVGAAMLLAARKCLAASPADLGPDLPAEASALGHETLAEALALSRDLFANPDPWSMLDRHRLRLPTEPEVDSQFDPMDALGTVMPGREGEAWAFRPLRSSRGRAE